jgi:RNA polymerase sigma-70 factor (ECF subfamily)
MNGGAHVKPYAVPWLGSLTDEELARLYAEYGCAEAIGELALRYSNKITRLALRITRSEADAEEVLQDVFLTLLKKIHTFRGEAKLSSWLYRVALNTAYMHAQGKSRKEANEVSLEDHALYDEIGRIESASERGWSRLPEQELLNREGLEVMEKAIGELPPKYRTVFHLGDVEGMPDQEVASTLGLTLSATKSRKRRARLFLRKRLSGYFYERHLAQEEE